MYKQKDILLIPIPFTDLTSNKKRPVLVLSNDEYNKTNQDILVSAITSNIEKRKYSVIIEKTDLSEGELKVKSMIRVDKIYTLSQKIVIKKFGAVNEKCFNQIIQKIHKLIESKS